MTDTVPVTFSYRSSTAQSVEVAGDWDSWSARVQLSKVAGQQQDGQDLWQATKQLKPSSKFQYKFIQNGDDWHTRDDLPTETDSSGNKNNVLESPEAQHAASVDESKEKTPVEVIGAGVTAAVGAAIAGVVGTDPFETDKQAIATTPGLTAGSDKQLNATEKESALLSSAQGAPAGAAAAGSNGTVPTEQLSNLGLSEGKNPADAGAAAIAAAAAGSTAAIPAGSSTGTSGISPQSLETIQKSSPNGSQTTPQQGTLDQAEAAKGLGAGASGDAPSVGSTTDGKATNASPLDGLVAGAAGAGAALAGGAAAAAAAISAKTKEASAAAQEKVAQVNDNAKSQTTVSGQPSAAAASDSAAKNVKENGKRQTTISGAPAAEDDKSFSKAATGAAATAAAATTAAAAGVGAALTGKGDQSKPDTTPAVGGNPSKETDAGIKAGAASAAAASSSAANATTPAPKQLSETAAKQEQLSSGPTVASTTSADAAPQQSAKNATNDRAAAAVAAGTTAAAVGGTAAGVTSAKASKPEQSETVAKQEQISSGPIAAPSQSVAAPALARADANTTADSGNTAAPVVAPVAAPTATTATAPANRRGDVTPPRAAAGAVPTSVEYNGETPVSTAPPTPAKTPNKSDTIGAKRGSRFGTRRKSKDLARALADNEGGDVSESGEVFKTAPSTAENTPERKTLERSRKKSFFGKLKEKLTSPGK